MILAGKTFVVHMADGTDHTVKVLTVDELRYEREQHTSLHKLVDEDGSPYFGTVLGLLHVALRRAKVEVPEFDEFVEAIGDNPFDVADEGKAADSALEPATG